MIQSVLEKFEGSNSKKTGCHDDDNDSQANCLSSYDKTIYENELNIIKSNLELDFFNESELIEFDFLIGKIF